MKEPAHLALHPFGQIPTYNTVEPPILELVTARLLEGDKLWSKERLPLVENRVRYRLKQFSARLGDTDWLDAAFSAGDLMSVSVLLRLKSSGILCDWYTLSSAAT